MFNYEVVVSNAMESAIVSSMKDTVQYLSKKYGFDYEEAMRETIGMNEKKVTLVKTGKKVKPVAEPKLSPKFALPFSGQIIEDRCQAVLYNKGLLSQCLEIPSQIGILCAKCAKQSERSPTGEPPFGLITARLEQGEAYQAPNGKKPIHFTSYMKKVNITKEMVLAEVNRLSLPFNDEHFNEPGETKAKGKGKRGRKASKNTEVQVETEEEDEDIFEDKPHNPLQTLIQSQFNSTEPLSDLSVSGSESENEKSEKSKKSDKSSVKEAKKAAKEEEKKAKEEAKEAEKKAKEAAKEEEKKAKEEAKEAEKKAKEAAKEAEKKAKEAAKEAEKKAKEDAKKAKEEEKAAKEAAKKAKEEEKKQKEEEKAAKEAAKKAKEEEKAAKEAAKKAKEEEEKAKEVVVVPEKKQKKVTIEDDKSEDTLKLVIYNGKQYKINKEGHAYTLDGKHVGYRCEKTKAIILEEEEEEEEEYESESEAEKSEKSDDENSDDDD
jgi:hypothetical protein